jgi:hypothetical protein
MTFVTVISAVSAVLLGVWLFGYQVGPGSSLVDAFFLLSVAAFLVSFVLQVARRIFDVAEDDSHTGQRD